MRNAVFLFLFDYNFSWNDETRAHYLSSDLRNVQQPLLGNIVLFSALPQTRLINLSATKIELNMRIYTTYNRVHASQNADCTYTVVTSLLNLQWWMFITNNYQTQTNTLCGANADYLNASFLCYI
jgi:hypothetical protein